MSFGNTMNDNRKKGGGAILFLAATMLPAGSAFAQAVPVPQETPRTIPGLVIAVPTPSPAQTAVPVPTVPVLGLSKPTPKPTPTPTPTATLRAVETARPLPVRTPAPTRTQAEPRAASTEPTPTDRPTPEASPTTTAVPVPLPSPDVTPDVAPSAGATHAPVAVPEAAAAWPWLAIGAGLVAVLVLATGIFFRLRPRRRTRVVAEIEPTVSVPVVAPPPPPPVPASPRARIDVALRPLRAGLNMLSAVVEAEVVVTNVGDAPAAQLRIHATLLSAHAAQQADLDATFAAPPAGRPATPPFALAPGEERRVRVVAALSREAVRSMEAGGRLMFVPLLAIDVRYAADAAGTSGRAGQAFIVGVERVDSAKLAPFWLDGPLRMNEQVAARAQGQPYIA